MLAEKCTIVWARDKGALEVQQRSQVWIHAITP